ncbi:MAG: contact-dependent growth inhibition system immunity protein [Myxococcota bacterium]
MALFDTREKRLRNFFVSCFHQEWPEEYGDVRSALEDYLNVSDILPAVIRDLRTFAAEEKNTPSDALWELTYMHFGSHYDGGNVGIDAHEWLRETIDYLERNQPREARSR